eukprot:281817-Chlamydomonas_euryale.AAC.4
MLRNTTHGSAEVLRRGALICTGGRGISGALAGLHASLKTNLPPSSGMHRPSLLFWQVHLAKRARSEVLRHDVSSVDERGRARLQATGHTRHLRQHARAEPARRPGQLLLCLWQMEQTLPHEYCATACGLSDESAEDLSHGICVHAAADCGNHYAVHWASNNNSRCP